MRRYETIFITLPDLPSEEMDAIIERYSTLITSLNGIVVKVDIWGKRRLAYPIRKRQDGYYILVDFVGENEVRAEFERNLKFDENILRAQSVKLSDKIDMAEIEREIAEAKSREAAAEAEAEAKSREAVAEAEADDVGTVEETQEEPEIVASPDAEAPLTESEAGDDTEEEKGVEE